MTATLSRTGSLAVLLCLLLVPSAQSRVQGADVKETLIAAILAEDADARIQLIQKLAESNDPLAGQTLAAWRQGELYIMEPEDAPKIPFLLDAQTSVDGKARGIRIADGQPLLDETGAPAWLAPEDLTAVDTDSKLRRAIKTTLDLLALNNPNPKMRRDAIVKLGQDQNAEFLPFFEARLALESDGEAKRALREASAITRLNSEKADERAAAIDELGAIRSINGLEFLRNLEKEARANPAQFGDTTARAARVAVLRIENYIFRGNLVGTVFRGLSLSAVLLVAALGLAITFGLMGVINMAHGEIMVVGAYAAFVTQEQFKAWFGAGGSGFEWYFPAAIALAFSAGALAGLALERGIVRFLYSRPLESLLATWGVSLILQQLFRAIFGAANVQVDSPAWLSGSFSVYDVLFAYNRLFVIAFALFVVLLTYFLLAKTSIGLQVRAVMQNRNMAACVGVRTNRIYMVTFAFGSGLAGMAGACLSQLGNVGPNLGQNYIVDCFMIVVLGGVGNIIGTISAALGVGVTDQILQPFLGAVLGKITVLIAIILFLQWRPSGLFATRGRSLES